MRFLRRPTVAGLTLIVAIVCVALAIARWVSDVHPEAARRRSLALGHARDAKVWRSVPESFRNFPRGTPVVPFELAGLHPAGILADSKRFDATGRPWEYRYGTVGQRWLGPAQEDRSEASIREDFFALCLEKSAYHSRMAEKWHSAARLPWLPIAPDPPAPPLVYDPPPSDSW
jgi:hypothetical protein